MGLWEEYIFGSVCVCASLNSCARGLKFMYRVLRLMQEYVSVCSVCTRIQMWSQWLCTHFSRSTRAVLSEILLDLSVHCVCGFGLRWLCSWISMLKYWMLSYCNGILFRFYHLWKNKSDITETNIVSGEGIAMFSATPSQIAFIPVG